MTRKTGFISDDLAATVVPTAPTTLQVGGPCQVGRIPAVVAEAADEDGAVVARFRGMFRMPVVDTGGVAPGDKIWFNATDSSLSKTSTGAIQFGYAMESIADGDGVTDILVLLRGGNIPAIVPGVPTGLATSFVGNSGVGLSWTPPVGEFGESPVYDARRKLTSDTEWPATPNSEGRTTTTAQFLGLTASTSYDFQVRARNSAGASAWTAALTAVTTA